MLSDRYFAARRWLITEVGLGAPEQALQARALKELKRPRDYTHKIWAQEFLKLQAQQENRK